MGKVRKYEDKILIEAIEKYAETFPTGKIKAVKLAEWARENIYGLEDVNDRDFLRSSDKNGGKIIRQCRKRLDEINISRKIGIKIKSNILLQSANIDDFFMLDKGSQRREILETRRYMDELMQNNNKLKKINEMNISKLNRTEEKNIELEEKNNQIEMIQKKIIEKQKIIFDEWEKIKIKNCTGNTWMLENTSKEEFLDSLEKDVDDIDTLLNNKNEELYEFEDVLKGICFDTKENN